MTAGRFLVQLFSAAAFAADAYVGAQACRPCHPAQFQRQTATGHAQTLSRAAGHPLAERFPVVSKLRSDFEWSLENREGAARVKIRDTRADSSEIEIPLDWAFGSGTHGVTFVSRLSQGVYLEHAFSFYPQPNRFDFTPGHRKLPGQTAMEAAGQTFQLNAAGGAIVRCFQCHSTGPARISARQEVTVTEQGVRCEACHGSGQSHVRGTAARSLRSLPADDVLNLCGRCHRPPDGSDAPNDFANPWNVRHQPPYLRQSKCFQASGDALSCFTCHEPHDALRRSDSEYYRRKCMACHESGPGVAPSDVCIADRGSDCTGCHMPSVAPDPNLRFRNHWIGVYRGGTNLIPSR